MEEKHIRNSNIVFLNYSYGQYGKLMKGVLYIHCGRFYKRCRWIYEMSYEFTLYQYAFGTLYFEIKDSLKKSLISFVLIFAFD